MPQIVLTYAAMTALAAALVHLAGLPSLTAPPPDHRLLASLGLALVLVATILLAGHLLRTVGWYQRMSRALHWMLTSPEMLGLTLDRRTALGVALASSIGEEALFRGFLQPWLIDLLTRFADPTTATVAGLVLASAIFALAHFPLFDDLRPWTLYAFLVGLALGALAAWSGSLLAPIVAHLLINLLSILHLGRQPPP